jgi:chemotaxis protein methyltransferase CheR
VTATEIDSDMICQAQQACYPFSSVKPLPPAWRQTAFEPIDDQYCLCPEYRSLVDFQLGDVENATFAAPYHLVCCRNLVFTYFGLERQALFLSRLHSRRWPEAEPWCWALMKGCRKACPDGGRGIRGYRFMFGNNVGWNAAS